MRTLARQLVDTRHSWQAKNHKAISSSVSRFNLFRSSIVQHRQEIAISARQQRILCFHCWCWEWTGCRSCMSACLMPYLWTHVANDLDIRILSERRTACLDVIIGIIAMAAEEARITRRSWPARDLFVRPVIRSVVALLSLCISASGGATRRHCKDSRF